MSRTAPVTRIAAMSALVVGVSSLTLPAAFANASARSHSLSDDLVARAGGHAAFRAASGDAGTFFGATAGHAAARPADISASASPSDAAKGWLAHYGSLFHAGGRLVVGQVQHGISGGAVVRFHQTVSGLPVIGGDVTVALDRTNALLSAAGHTSSLARIDTTAQVSEAAATRVAVRNVEKHVGRVVVRPTGDPTLSVFDPAVVPSPFASSPTSVWDVEVTSADGSVRHRVFVDAHAGKLVADLNENPQAANDHIVCEPSAYYANQTLANERVADPSCPGTSVTEVGTDSSAPSGDTDAVNAYNYAVDVDDFYSTLLHRNSLDNHGMTIASTVHYCPENDVNFPQDTPCPYPNAFWDGQQMVYGDGYTAGLDVVGHEMTHGVTEKTSKLMSYYQSGAINESESDVMGEMIQQIVGLSSGDTAVYDPTKPWQIGEKLPALSDHQQPFLRFLNDPTQDQVDGQVSADPDSMTSPNYSSDAFYNDMWDTGGVHANDGVGNKAAYLIAAGANGDGTSGSFNGVPGITGVSGADQLEKDVKVANIYYHLESLMWSSTTYADLYNLLPQSCNQLATTASVTHDLPMPGGGHTNITPADCAQVGLAVKATKMNVLPTKAGAVTPKPSPFCTNGGSPTRQHVAAFETNPFSAGTYKRSHSTSLDPYYDQNEIGDWWWSKTTIGYYGSAAPLYQDRGSTASLWGDDIDPTYIDPSQSTYSYEDARVQSAAAIKPSSGTFVRFDHSWEFEYGPEYSGGPVKNFDGGRVEYSVDGGRTWYDAGAASPVDTKALFVTNGYNGTISNTTDLKANPPYGDPNPLRGHRGFVQSSHGWTASRLDLSSLRGKSVLLRWRIGTDDVGGSYGWYVDNVTSYSCNPTHISISAPAKVKKGAVAVVRGHVVRSGTSTAIANLPVRLWEKRHGTTHWVLVGTHLTSKYGNVSWSRKHTVAFDYRVKMPGKTPYAPSNIARTTVRIG